MKYVWASWAIKTSQYFTADENIQGSRTRHVRGYGCAVTFSSTHIGWSSPDATYASEQWRFMKTSFTKG